MTLCGGGKSVSYSPYLKLLNETFKLQEMGSDLSITICLIY